MVFHSFLLLMVVLMRLLQCSPYMMKTPERSCTSRVPLMYGPHGRRYHRHEGQLPY